MKVRLNTATGQQITQTTNASGAYNSGALIPGQYKIQITAPGFSTVSVPVTVQLGNTSNGNAKLQVGQESQVVEVQATSVQVNTEQPTVQGVLNAEQIENLPVNGRNFLELALLTPGNAPAPNFDPTKTNTVVISSAGQFGRGSSVTVDGADTNDDVVGGAVQRSGASRSSSPAMPTRVNRA